MADVRGSDPVEDPDLTVVTRPRNLQVMLWATGIWAAFVLISAVSLFGYRSYVHRNLITSNENASKPKANYVGSVVDHDVSRCITSTLLISVLTAGILVALAGLSVRGKSSARWALLVIALGLPAITCGVPPAGLIYHLVVALGSVPILYRALEVAAALASLVVVIQIMAKPTRAWFHAIAPAKPSGGLLARGAGARPATGTGPAGRPSMLTALLGRRGQAMTAKDASVDVSPAGSSHANAAGSADSRTADAEVASGRSKRRATRPGSVKPKGPSGPGTARAKSRQR